MVSIIMAQPDLQKSTCVCSSASTQEIYNNPDNAMTHVLRTRTAKLHLPWRPQMGHVQHTRCYADGDLSCGSSDTSTNVYIGRFDLHQRALALACFRGHA